MFPYYCKKESFLEFLLVYAIFSFPKVHFRKLRNVIKLSETESNKSYKARFFLFKLTLFTKNGGTAEKITCEWKYKNQHSLDLTLRVG